MHRMPHAFYALSTYKIVSTRKHHSSPADRIYISNNKYSAYGEAVGYMYFIVHEELKG